MKGGREQCRGAEMPYNKEQFRFTDSLILLSLKLMAKFPLNSVRAGSCSQKIIRMQMILTWSLNQKRLPE